MSMTSERLYIYIYICKYIPNDNSFYFSHLGLPAYNEWVRIEICVYYYRRIFNWLHIIMNRSSEDENRYKLLSPQALFELVDLHLAFLQYAFMVGVGRADMLSILHGTILSLFRNIWNIHILIIDSDINDINILGEE